MRRQLLASGLALSAALVAACGATNFLAPARLTNELAAVTLAAIDGTPISAPSALNIADNIRVRTDQSAAFDFAYNILPDGRRVLLPLNALGVRSGLGLEPGFQTTTATFENIGDAPLNGWRTTDTIPVAVGTTLLVRSRLVCNVISASLYARIVVDAFDDAQRTVTFRMVANRNCGYRSLRLGIPTS